MSSQEEEFMDEEGHLIKYRPSTGNQCTHSEIT